MSTTPTETQGHRLTFDSGQLSDRDEVWDGEYVVSPLATVAHQWMISHLGTIFFSVTDPARGDHVYPGLNVSDRDAGWTHNFRIPDVGVVLADNPARDCGTHLCGGPDVVVEILSKADRAREKAEFYAAVGVREFWIIDPDPLRLDLLRSDGESLVAVGTIEAGSTAELASAVLPLMLRVIVVGGRSRIEVRRAAGDQVWTL